MSASVHGLWMPWLVVLLTALAGAVVALLIGVLIDRQEAADPQPYAQCRKVVADARKRMSYGAEEMTRLIDVCRGNRAD